MKRNITISGGISEKDIKESIIPAIQEAIDEPDVRSGEPIKLPILVRGMDVDDFEVRDQKNKPLRITFSASSRYPVDRIFGDEVLDHDEKSVRLDRVASGTMPLLFNHNMDDPIGMVDTANVSGERLIVDAHLFSTARAKEVETMVRDGLRNISIGYRIHKAEEEDGTVFIREWEPFEASIVTVPADPTVGIGRSEEYEVRILRAEHQPANTAEFKEDTMSNETASAGEDAEKVKEEPVKKEEVRILKEESPKSVDLEISRKRAISNLCQANNLDEKYRDMWVGQGISIEDVSDEILTILEERGKSNPQPASKLGLTTQETKNFSFVRAIQAIADKDWKNAGFELECSRGIAQKLGTSPDPHKFYVPFEVMERPKAARRDLDVATAGAAGYLVETENMGFIEMVRNRSVAFSMGARRLSGLQGSVTVPRQSAAATGYWLATESTQITESEQTFVQMALTPKNVGAYTEISRQLLLQSSPGAEGIVTDDLAQVVAIAADLGALEGSGASGQPTGITNTAGIGAVTGTTFDYAALLESQTDVAAANVTPMNGGYVTTPAVAALLMQRERFSSTDTPLWEGNIWNGRASGFNAMSSNQLTAATMIFGDWQELVIAEWGVLEVEVNPYANFQAGIIGVRAMYSMDVGVRRPFAFSLTTGIT